MKKKNEFPETEQATTPAKPATKPAAAKKTKAVKKEKKPATKPVKAKVKKPAGLKPGHQKKKTEKKPKKPPVAEAKKAPKRKPGKKPAVKKSGLIGRKTDLLKMGEGAFLYSLELTRRVEEMEREIAGYQRAFEAIRELFSREMDEIEEWLGVVLK